MAAAGGDGKEAPVSGAEGTGDSAKKDVDSVAYHLSMVDGTETTLSLSPTASIYDACVAAAAWKGLHPGQIRLVVQGQVQPLPHCRKTHLREAAGGITDLLAVISRTYFLGAGTGPLATKCTSTQFEHYPSSAYLADEPVAEPAEIKMELCEGQRVEAGGPKEGVMFCQTRDGDSVGLCPSLTGRILMRVFLQKHEWACGIGAGTMDTNLSQDPEYQKHFLGLYHGGGSRNVCAYASRTHETSNGWDDNQRLAILFDFHKGVMQCYEDLSPFGRPVRIQAGEELWKPTDDPDFVRWSKNLRLGGSASGATYIVEDYVASGSFSRVFRVRKEGGEERRRRWGPGGEVLAAKVMRKEDAYIQYTSSGPGEGQLLQRLESAQLEAGAEVLTMRCLDSFATKDDAGKDYWCLILEWLDASLFDVVRMNGNRGLHLSMVRVMLTQLLQQLKVLQEVGCTHTDIKHKNCCLASTEHYVASLPGGGSTMILTQPLVKFIDYGNAVFEGDKKPHPIHTKQFRAPEVLLNIRVGVHPATPGHWV
ncbi:yakA [Symbiodinium natans]|uniref:YakA protein n=1 Tax=Symbiodinium natans TaxID=878477 RepID=A0A812MAL6_9DINO|nr:yakA [Symbiodinium natans]